MMSYGKKATPNICEGEIGSLIVMTSFGVQCDLLPVPPLQRFSSNGHTTELIFSGEPEPEPELNQKKLISRLPSTFLRMKPQQSE